MHVRAESACIAAVVTVANKVSSTEGLLSAASNRFLHCRSHYARDLWQLLACLQ
jgi:hypothetical protein